MSMDFDFSELRALAAQLEGASDKVAPNLKKAITVTARYVKDDWRKGAKRTGLAGYASSIDYDVNETAEGVEAEIGPNLGKYQGRFGFVEEANGGVQSNPQHAGRDAARKNEKDFVDGIEKAIGDLL